MEKTRLNLLKSLEEELKETEGIGEMSLFTAKELSSPVDVLRAEIADFGSDLKSVLGEFFFLPFEGTEVLYFSTIITLTGVLPREAVPDAVAAVARLNYYLPCGCYAIGDNDKNLIYRFTMPINAGEDKDKQEAAVSFAANAAIMVAEKFEGYLKLVISGEITVDEMVGMMGKEG
ncbi:MAG: hypothetical protein IJT24_02340 [Lachnospiraceae bacterium]|nr:hypothetical protein [Lachnospiraceae bacterium]